MNTEGETAELLRKDGGKTRSELRAAGNWTNSLHNLNAYSPFSLNLKAYT